MEINGKEIANNIKENIKKRVEELYKKGITPKLAIITVGNEASWQAYVSQKQKIAAKLGIEVVLSEAKTPEDLFQLIQTLNNDSYVHGIIVQRPMPSIFEKGKVTAAIVPEKDVDGFRDDSPFGVPVWLAVQKMLDKVAEQNRENLLNFLANKTVTVLGKGETAGMPIIHGLQKIGVQPHIIDSKTENSRDLLKDSDIIISAVGKQIIHPENLKGGVVLIGVGIHRGEDGKLHNDYQDQEIKNVVSYYSPTPGGVGPVNLSFLFDNLIMAAEKRVV